MFPFNKNRGNEVGVILFYSLYIFYTLMVIPIKSEKIHFFGLNDFDLMTITSLLSIYYLWVKIEWALIPSVDERAKDNFFSVLPVLVLMGVGIIILVTNIDLHKNYRFCIESSLIFISVIIFDLLLIKKVGSVMLELKDKIHMR